MDREYRHHDIRGPWSGSANTQGSTFHSHAVDRGSPGVGESNTQAMAFPCRPDGLGIPSPWHSRSSRWEAAPEGMDRECPRGSIPIPCPMYSDASSNPSRLHPPCPRIPSAIYPPTSPRAPALDARRVRSARPRQCNCVRDPFRSHARSIPTDRPISPHAIGGVQGSHRGSIRGRRGEGAVWRRGRFDLQAQGLQSLRGSISTACPRDPNPSSNQSQCNPRRPRIHRAIHPDLMPGYFECPVGSLVT